MSLKVIASHLVEITFISKVFKYQVSILVKIIETAFSILRPECRGLRLKRNGLITHLKLVTRIPVKSAHCQVWLMGPTTQLQKVQNAGTDNP